MSSEPPHDDPPPWRVALTLFLGAGFRPGDVVPHDWFWSALAMERPGPETPYGDAQARQLRFLAQFDRLREYLLRERCIDLANERNVGYTIVPPSEQTRRATDDGQAEFRKALRRMAQRLTHVDTARLTAEQVKENAEAQARLSGLRGMVASANRRRPFEEGDAA